VHKIPATVLSRCQRHEFRRIPVNTIVKLLDELAGSEGVQVEPEALTLIARQSTGSLRDAISLLDQLASTGATVTLESAHQILGTAASQSVLEVVDALLARETAKGLDLIHAALDAGSDPRQFARQIVDYLRNVLLVLMKSAEGVDASAETRAAMAAHSQKFSLPELMGAIRAFNHAATEARLSFQPALPLELALIECVEGAFREAQAAPEATPATPGRPARATRGRAPIQEPAPSQEPRLRGQRLPRARAASQGPAPSRSYAQADAPAVDHSIEDRPGSGSESGFCRLCQRAAQHGDGAPKLEPHQRPDPPAQLADPGILHLLPRVGFQGRLPGAGHERLCQSAPGNPRTYPPGRAGPGRGIRKARSDPLHRVNGKASAPADVDSDGIVATALRDLGGEIVDVQ
jgi:DNA polymerase III gamma/tau subunit